MDTAVIGEPIVEEVLIDASPEQVFPYLVEADLITKWMGNKVGASAKVGGPYHMYFKPGHTAVGEYQVVDSPSRVVFTFGWDAPENPTAPGSTTVEITLTAQDGGTLVRLVHTGLAEVTRADHTHGWNLYMGRLAVVAAGGDPGAEPNS